MKSKYYITTSIAYANAKPHLGHALEAVQADVLARFRRSQGDEVRFLTGTDEHGQKIAKAASDVGRPVQELVDEVAGQFQELYSRLGISFDRFIRTTDADHKKAAQALWTACEKDIYKGSYTGLYCVGCEQFYTPRDLIDGKKCPQHLVELEEITIESYFFKLSAYQQQIEELIQSDSIKIYPQARKNEVLSFVRSGLEDISISRTRKMLEWGIEVPGDKDHVMYVWFDALTNYITGAGFETDNDAFAKWWPANLHCIGKDILRFHAVMWPAMLLSGGLQPPKAINVHGFLSIEGQKMSKSLGNVIDPEELALEWGVDAVRYYLLREIPSGLDGDYSRSRFETVYNTELANDLGNLVQRTATMIERYQGGKIGEVPAFSHDINPYGEAMTNLKFDAALAEIWLLVKGLNQYIEEEKPWQLAKEDTGHLQEVLAHVVSDLRQLARLLLPFIPHAAQKIAKTFEGESVDMSVGILFPRKVTETDAATR